MIINFFREYRFVYLIYFSLSGLFLLTFLLYRLPLAYFGISFLLNVTIFIIFSSCLYIRFSHKMTTLKHFAYLDELNQFHSPSEMAYRDLIASLKEAEVERIIDSKNQIEQLERMVKMWVHQMKIPLAAISLMVQTDHLEKQEIQQQLLRQQNDIDKLLNYLKFNQQNDDFRFEEISMKALINQIIKKYSINCLAKELSVDIQGDWQIKSDKKWLSFALSQIIDNAIKYSRKNGNIIISIQKGQVLIQDHGIGILKEDLPRIFEDGFTGYNGHEHQKATGFGLYMAKQVLDQLNLKIRIDSQIEEGTVVSIKQA